MRKKQNASIKTCVGFTPDNMKMLEKWHEDTGLSKSDILNLLIENAVKNKVQLQVTYELGE